MTIWEMLRILLVLVVLCFTLAGSVQLFYTFSDQDQDYVGLPGAYNKGSAITFIVSALTLAPLLNVLSFFLEKPILVVVAAGLTAVLSPNFLVQLGFFSACQKGDNLAPVCSDTDVPVALAGYCLLMLAVYASFLVCPGRLRRFPQLPHKILLVLALVLASISLIAAILFAAAAGQNSVDNGWSETVAQLIRTSVLNFQAALFFLVAVLIDSEPLNDSALFYLGSFYAIPLLPSLTDSAKAIDTGETNAGSALGYIGIVVMLIFLVHRSIWPQRHHELAEEASVEKF